MSVNKIDLNSDVGESFGNYKLGMDEDVIPLISSANIACGWHAGDPLVMWAFEPGLDQEGNPREKPPVPRGDYILAVRKWVSAGAPIPE